MKAIFLLVLFVATISFGIPESEYTFKLSPVRKTYKTGYQFIPRTQLHGNFDGDLQQSDTPIPDTYDLRPKITPIQDQGSCGSCWAFSTTQTMADALFMFGTYPGQPSQQYMVDCDNQNSGCGGGDFNSLDTVVSPKGAPLASEYPYTARDGRCKSLPGKASIVEWHYVGSQSQEPSTADIQRAILIYGPASVDISANGNFMNYSSGIYNACNGSGINHMTGIVGWSNEGAIANSNGAYPVGKGYWIMRNSWGKSWGEQGFMRIRYVDSRGNKCNQIGTTAAYVKVLAVPKDPIVFTLVVGDVTLTATVQPTAAYSVDAAKAALTTALQSLGGKNALPNRNSFVNRLL